MNERRETPAHGAQNRAPLYEAHLFLTVDTDQVSPAADVLRLAGFRLSGRSKRRKDGRLDVIATRNDDEYVEIETSMRSIATKLLDLGFCVYRMRLERMMFDEVLTNTPASMAARERRQHSGQT